MPSSVGHGLMGLSLAWFAASVPRTAGPLRLSRSQQWAMALGLRRPGGVPGCRCGFWRPPGPNAQPWCRRAGDPRVGGCMPGGADCRSYSWPLHVDWPTRRISRLIGWGKTAARHAASCCSGHGARRTTRRAWICFLKSPVGTGCPQEVIWGNLRSIAWELILLIPVAVIAWKLRTRSNEQ